MQFHFPHPCIPFSSVSLSFQKVQAQVILDSEALFSPMSKFTKWEPDLLVESWRENFAVGSAVPQWTGDSLFSYQMPLHQTDGP